VPDLLEKIRGGEADVVIGAYPSAAVPRAGWPGFFPQADGF